MVLSETSNPITRRCHHHGIDELGDHPVVIDGMSSDFVFGSYFSSWHEAFPGIVNPARSQKIKIGASGMVHEEPIVSSAPKVVNRSWVSSLRKGIEPVCDLELLPCQARRESRDSERPGDP